jgi:hypothetical protein
MAIRLDEVVSPQIRLGSALRESRRRARPGRALMTLALQALVTGVLVGLAFAWQHTPASTLLLGVGIVAWVLISFGVERPDIR